MAGENSLAPYKTLGGLGLKGELLVRRGEVRDGLRLAARSTQAGLRISIANGLFVPAQSAAMAEGLASLGQRSTSRWRN